MIPKAIIFICAITITSTSFAEDLYEAGKKALDGGDYITALKDLFAYKKINAEKLAQHPDFAKALDSGIAQAERNLRNNADCKPSIAFPSEATKVWASATGSAHRPETTVNSIFK